MRQFKEGIYMGIISIVSSLILIGIPIGPNFFEIITALVFCVGLFVVLYVGIWKDSTYTTRVCLIYVASVFVIGGIAKLLNKDCSLMAVGFLPGLIIALAGIMMSLKNKEYNVKVSLVINGLALFGSILSCFLGYMANKGFLIVK